VTQTISSAVVVIPLLFSSMMLLPLLWMTKVIRLSFLRFGALSAFVVYAMAVIHVTMFPLKIVPESMRPEGLVSSSIHLTPLTNIDDISFTLNVIMMIPLGFLLPLIAPKLGSLKSITIAGFVTSAAIEGMQLLMLVTLGNRRIIEVDDLIANTGGAIIGYLAFIAMFSTALAIAGEFGRQPARLQPKA
jgi:glycopeptide antibiotics resistance protein